jgi:tetratricopeptide (TPR) repeat protein
MPRIDLTEEEQSKYSIFHNLIAALDRYDRGEKPEAESLAKAMLNWENTNKLGWVRVLLHWYCGLRIDLDELAEELSPDERTRLYFYAGVKYEIDDRGEEAIKCYNKALSQKNVRVAEVDLVKFRMGSFYIDQKGYFYSESTPVLVERVNGTLVKHGLANLFDKRPAIAWVPINAQNALINIQLYVEYKVDGVEITNGYAKSESLFKKNSRVKTLSLIFSDGSERRINLKDTMTPQYVAIDKNTKLLRFQVVDVYKGEQYQDLCISELRVDIKQSRRSD